jgi:hypothetical protein
MSEPINYEVDEKIHTYMSVSPKYNEGKYESAEVSVSPASWVEGAPPVLKVKLAANQLRELAYEMLRTLFRLFDRAEDEQAQRTIHIDTGWSIKTSADYVSSNVRELRIGPLVLNMRKSSFDELVKAVNDVEVPKLYVEDGTLEITRYWAATQILSVDVSDLLDGEAEYDEEMGVWVYEGTEDELEELYRQAAQGDEEPGYDDDLHDWDVQDWEIDDKPEVTEATGGVADEDEEVVA